MISSIVLCGVFIILYGIIIEVFTVLFQLTGITREKARTQVVSMLTNCGFTTSESEIIMSSKRRRSLARITMLCGYSFAVIIVSILVNIFLVMKQTEIRSWMQTIIIMSSILLLYGCVLRLQRVRQCFDKLIERLGSRLMFGKNSNILMLIDIVRNQALVEILLIHIPDCLGKKLSESRLREEYNIQILYIKRNGEPLSSIDGDTVVQSNDSILVFGDYKKIRMVFES